MGGGGAFTAHMQHYTLAHMQHFTHAHMQRYTQAQGLEAEAAAAAADDAYADQEEWSQVGGCQQEGGRRWERQQEWGRHRRRCGDRWASAKWAVAAKVWQLCGH